MNWRTVFLRDSFWTFLLWCGDPVLLFIGFCWGIKDPQDSGFYHNTRMDELIILAFWLLRFDYNEMLLFHFDLLVEFLQNYTRVLFSDIFIQGSVRIQMMFREKKVNSATCILDEGYLPDLTLRFWLQYVLCLRRDSTSRICVGFLLSWSSKFRYFDFFLLLNGSCLILSSHLFSSRLSRDFWGLPVPLLQKDSLPYERDDQSILQAKIPSSFSVSSFLSTLLWRKCSFYSFL